jgi:hypothetical protein
MVNLVFRIGRIRRKLQSVKSGLPVEIHVCSSEFPVVSAIATRIWRSLGSNHNNLTVDWLIDQLPCMFTPIPDCRREDLNFLGSKVFKSPTNFRQKVTENLIQLPIAEPGRRSLKNDISVLLNRVHY